MDEGMGPAGRELARGVARCATAVGLPFALWRAPGAADPKGVVAFSGAAVRSRVEFGAPRPGFALSRFDNLDGERCDVIVADAVLSDGGLRFVGENGRLRGQPTTQAGRGFAKAVAASGRAGEPVIGRGSPLLRCAEPPRLSSEDEYRALVERSLEAIRAGAFEKVVASRATERALPPGFDAVRLFESLCGRHAQAFVCLVAIPGIGCWITATPELFLAVAPSGARTVALAGTQPIAAGADTGDVLWSDKFIEEQALVAAYVRTAFRACGISEYSERGPRTVRAANLAHLQSSFEVSLSSHFSDPALFPETCTRLLRALHPTSAVCGMPREAALAFLREHEGYDRGYYCGYLGPVNVEGRSELYVNLRSAQFIGEAAYLYVGAGVTAGSSSKDEWLETVEKSKTLGATIQPA